MGSQVLKAAGLCGLLILLISFFSCHNQGRPQLPYYNAPDFTPLWLQDGKATDTLHTIAPFSFTDQQGATINNESFRGKVYVANFFFTSCPGICPKMMKNMKTVADTFRNDRRVAFISHSVTPDIDSVPRLHSYGQKHAIDAVRWHLVTGRQKDIYQLARQSYFVEKEIGFNLDSSQFLHTEHFILVDRNGHIRGIYNGTVALDMLRLEDDIRILLKQ